MSGTILTQMGIDSINLAMGTDSPSLAWETIVFGDGGGVVPTFTKESTMIVNEVYRTDVLSVTRDATNNPWHWFEAVIPAEVGNFWVREIGILNSDGVLVAVGTFPETFKPILNGSENVAKTVHAKVSVQLSTEANVTFSIDPTIVMASQSWVNVKIEDVKNETSMLLEEEKANNILIVDDYLANEKESLFIDTTAKIINVTLPLAAKDLKVWITDLKSNFEVNKIVVLRNGATIMNIAENMDVDKNNISFLMHCVEVEENRFDWRIR